MSDLHVPHGLISASRGGLECAGRPLDSERQLIAHRAEEEGERVGKGGGWGDGGIISPPSALSVFLKVEPLCITDSNLEASGSGRFLPAVPES